MRTLSRATAALFAPVMQSRYDKWHFGLDKTGDQFLCEVYQISQVMTKQSPSTLHRAVISRFPEHRRLESEFFTYQIGATDISCALIAGLLPVQDISLVTFDHDADIVFRYWLKQIAFQEMAADRYARFKVDGLLPPEADGIVAHPDYPIKPFQIIGTVSAMQSTGFGLTMEQGTGKTVTTLARICAEAPQHYAKTGKPYYVLIVAPKNVRLNWKAEAEKFATCPITTTVIRGNRMERCRLMLDVVTSKTPASIAVISYEAATKMRDEIKSLKWQLTAIDESHFIRNPSTLRCKTCWFLRDRSERRMILSGTPCANSILDYYSQLEFLGKHLSGFTSFAAFKRFYGTFYRDETGREQISGFQNLPFMQERLSRLTYRVTKAEALPDLPELLPRVREVQMTAEQTHAYESLRDNLILEIENDLESDAIPKTLLIQNILVKFLRLAQVTSGYIKFDPVFNEQGEKVREGTVDRFDPNPKIDALIEELGEKEANEKTIVWCCFRQNIKSVSAALTLAGFPNVTFYGETKDADRAEAERTFNEDRECRAFIGSPDSGGTGLNLIGYPPGKPEHHDCDVTTQYIFSQNWFPLPRQQAIARAHRMGTRRNVTVVDLVVPGSIDEEIRLRVLEKNITAWEIADIRRVLRAIRTGVLSDE